MKKKVAIIAGVIILGIAGITVGKSVIKPKKVETIPTVQVDNVKTQQMITTVEAKGTVAFRDKVSVYAKNSGKVSSRPIKEGDPVNKGDVLVQYDQSSLKTLKRQLEDAKLSLQSANLTLQGLMLPADESQLKQLESQISQSEKNILDLENNLIQVDKDINKAQTDLDGANILYSQGAISKSEFDKFETSLTTLKNQKIGYQNSLDAAKKQLEANKAQYENTKNKASDPNTKNKIDSQKVMVEQAQLKVNQLTKDINDFETASISPITGTLVKLHVVDGEAVTEGKIVAEVGNLNDVIIEANIPEYDMEGVAVGQDVLIKSESIEGEYKGKITKIYPLAELKNIGGSEKSVVKVEISMPNNTPLKTGYTTNLTITTKIDDNALVIPIMSYMSEKVNDKNSEYVFVVKEDGTLEKRTVKVKTIKNSVASVEGLSEGEKVVFSPTENMKEGMKIIPTDQPVQPQGKSEQGASPIIM
ncbi:efflux RND transporter periplasmic adaptor subunit [[Clostridium] colinum]|uniref:efflux RND transporter periplasmic adaptor subunit n=1 Tax=[Clostridium] colinum TaxID=36835 RepID=UPI002025B20E|nr:efflux RND transporter periplasmic adaptor subunit [[Clostridium] colinum]